jgi:hypothetical protein
LQHPEKETTILAAGIQQGIQTGKFVGSTECLARYLPEFDPGFLPLDAAICDR